MQDTSPNSLNNEPENALKLLLKLIWCININHHNIWQRCAIDGGAKQRIRILQCIFVSRCWQKVCENSSYIGPCHSYSANTRMECKHSSSNKTNKMDPLAQALLITIRKYLFLMLHISTDTATFQHMQYDRKQPFSVTQCKPTEILRYLHTYCSSNNSSSK